MKHIKRFLSGLLVLCLMASMIPVTARAAESGTCGKNLTWTLSNDGTLTISGTGAMDNFYPYENYPSWDGYAYQIRKVIIESGVTSIGSDAFRYCSSLTNISIPNGVTSIGSAAFFDCSSLTNISIPNGVTSIQGNTFQNCSGLTNINIPNSVTSIGGYAFFVCI